MRHGEAAAPTEGGDDYRVLTGRGRLMARQVGQALAAARADRVIGVYTSPLLRAVQTAEILTEALQVEEVTMKIALPSPSEGYLSDLITQAPARWDALLVVGHEPVMSRWCAALSGQPWRPFQTAELRALELSPTRDRAQLLPAFSGLDRS